MKSKKMVCSVGGVVPLWLAILVGAAGAQHVDVKEHILPNGMKFLMVERHDSPTITCGWVARVGSVNEPHGITGISSAGSRRMRHGL